MVPSTFGWTSNINFLPVTSRPAGTGDLAATGRRARGMPATPGRCVERRYAAARFTPRAELVERALAWRDHQEGCRFCYSGRVGAGGYGVARLGLMPPQVSTVWVCNC